MFANVNPKKNLFEFINTAKGKIEILTITYIYLAPTKTNNSQSTESNFAIASANYRSLRVPTCLDKLWINIGNLDSEYIKLWMNSTTARLSPSNRILLFARPRVLAPDAERDLLSCRPITCSASLATKINALANQNAHPVRR